MAPPPPYFSLFNGWLDRRQIELVPNERVVQAWPFTDWEQGVDSIVRFTLTPKGAGTKLVVDQHEVPEALQEHVATNWQGFQRPG